MKQLILIFGLSVLPTPILAMNSEQAKVEHRINEYTKEIMLAQEHLKTVNALIEQSKPLSTNPLFKEKLWEIIRLIRPADASFFNAQAWEEKTVKFKALMKHAIKTNKNCMIYLANIRLHSMQNIQLKQIMLEKLKQNMPAQ